MTLSPAPGASGTADADDEALADVATARPHWGKAAWWAIGGGLAVTTALAAVWGLWMADDQVRWRNVGFEVISPTEASVTYDVFLYDDRPVVCHLNALNVRFAEVGVTTQHVDPALGAEQRLTATLSTTEEATTVVVDYCEPAP